MCRTELTIALSGFRGRTPELFGPVFTHSANMFRTVASSKISVEFGDFPSFPTASGVNGACDDPSGSTSYCYSDDPGGSTFFDMYQTRTQPKKTKKEKKKTCIGCNKNDGNANRTEGNGRDVPGKMEMGSLKSLKTPDDKQNKFLGNLNKYAPTPRRKPKSAEFAVETSFSDSVAQDFVNLNI